MSSFRSDSALPGLPSAFACRASWYLPSTHSNCLFVPFSKKSAVTGDAMFTVLGASWSQPGVKRHCQPGRVAGVRGPLSRRRVGRPRPLPCLSCQPFLGGRWPHWTDREDGVVGGPTTLQTWCNPHSTPGVTPGRPTMARQDLPPLECRGKGGLDQPSGKGERGGRGQLLAGGWEAEASRWRGVCNVSQIFYYDPLPRPTCLRVCHLSAVAHD